MISIKISWHNKIQQLTQPCGSCSPAVFLNPNQNQSYHHHHHLRVLLPQGGLIRMGGFLFARFERFYRVWLSRYGQDTFPGATAGIHSTRRSGNQLWNGQEHHAIVAQAYGKSSVPGKCAMNRILSKLHAVQ